MPWHTAHGSTVAAVAYTVQCAHVHSHLSPPLSISHAASLWLAGSTGLTACDDSSGGIDRLGRAAGQRGVRENYKGVVEPECGQSGARQDSGGHTNLQDEKATEDHQADTGHRNNGGVCKSAVLHQRSRDAAGTASSAETAGSSSQGRSGTKKTGGDGGSADAEQAEERLRRADLRKHLIKDLGFQAFSVTIRSTKPDVRGRQVAKPPDQQNVVFGSDGKQVIRECKTDQERSQAYVKGSHVLQALLQQGLVTSDEVQAAMQQQIGRSSSSSGSTGDIRDEAADIDATGRSEDYYRKGEGQSWPVYRLQHGQSACSDNLYVAADDKAKHRQHCCLCCTICWNS